MQFPLLSTATEWERSAPQTDLLTEAADDLERVAGTIQRDGSRRQS
jgi:hypothetical protein